MVSGILDSEVADEVSDELVAILVSMVVSEGVSVCDIVVLVPSLLVVSTKLLVVLDGKVSVNGIDVVVSETALV